MTLKTVYIARDALDPSSYEKHEAENVIEFLMQEFNDVWPETARLYHRAVAIEYDITPANELDVDRILTLEGDFFVVIYPAGPAVAAVVGSLLTNLLISFVSSILLSMIFSQAKPKAATLAQQPQANKQTTSANNQLSDRANRSRINGRIPDIYGQVLSIPDLISLPYKIYKNHQQVELSYMCIGRGEYDIQANDIKEAETRISEIAGSTVEIYAPFTSPNSVDAPQVIVGGAIVEPLVKPSELSAVNGQTLRPPNANNIRGADNIKFIYPDIIAAETSSGIDFTTRFAPSDILVVTDAATDGLDLAGEYTILSVAATEITLSNPSAENIEWDDIEALPDEETSWFSPLMETSGPKWVGPFFLDFPDLESVSTNFIAFNGLFKDDGRNQSRFDVTVEIELTPVDITGSPIGSAETFQTTIQGSATSRDARAVTLKATPTFSGRCKVRARRVTDADLTYEGSVVDEIKWERIYSIAPVVENDFGNVTTAYSQTYATAGALSVAERRLNMRVTRKLPQRVSGSTFTEETYATKSADDILSAICLDPYLGNRSPAEIDFDSIYDTIAAVKAYFGNDKAGEFSYTFDDDNTSFEEIVGTIAEVCFCTAYRQGNVLRLFFEQATEDSTILFNHRNKVPGSEKRTISFGNHNDNDGVEVDYINPLDDLTDTYFIPADRSAINPAKIETVGVRTHEQAFWLAWRAWNKIQYQNTAVEFEGTEEAAVCINQERLLVADNTRNITQDGEVISQNVLQLELSQKVKVEDGKSYVIFLQHYDGLLESIPITATDGSNLVVLEYAPRQELSLAPERAARTTYVIQTTDDPNKQAFLLTEKDPGDKNGVFTVRAINYNPLYYQQDNLTFWMPFFSQEYKDESPYSQVCEAQGDAAVEDDVTRGNSHVGAAATDFVTVADLVSDTSYTKTCWIKKDAGGTVGHILSNADEEFYIDSDGDICAGHDAVVNVTFPLPDYAEWAHVAVSYDATDDTMCLFLNGVMVDKETEVTSPAHDELTVFGNHAGTAFIGSCQDLRLYNRVLSAEEIKQIYRAA